MKTVSLKIDESIFHETEKILSRIKKHRNRYVNEALAHFNGLQRRVMLEEKLKKESALVGTEAMLVLKDFEALEDGD